MHAAGGRAIAHMLRSVCHVHGATEGLPDLTIWRPHPCPHCVFGLAGDGEQQVHTLAAAAAAVVAAASNSTTCSTDDGAPITAYSSAWVVDTVATTAATTSTSANSHSWVVDPADNGRRIVVSRSRSSGDSSVDKGQCVPSRSRSSSNSSSSSSGGGGASSTSTSVGITLAVALPSHTNSSSSISISGLVPGMSTTLVRGKWLFTDRALTALTRAAAHKTAQVEVDSTHAAAAAAAAPAPAHKTSSIMGLGACAVTNCGNDFCLVEVKSRNDVFKVRARV